MTQRLLNLMTVSLLVCVATGVAYLATARVSLYGPGGPHFSVRGSPWLGWGCVGSYTVWLVLFLRSVSIANQRNGRLRDGLCPSCGYNLTGNISGSCPECGAPTGTPTA